jgi:hypothetical protein
MVFVSYSRKDGRLVYPVVKAMRVTGEEIFLDVDNIKLGEDWNQSLEDAILSSRAFALFWSFASSRSELVSKEWTYAIQIGKANIIPLMLDRTPLPEELKYREGVSELATIYQQVKLFRKLRVAAYVGIGVLLIVIGMIAQAYFNPVHAQQQPVPTMKFPISPIITPVLATCVLVIFSIYLTLRLNESYARIAKLILGIEDSSGEQPGEIEVFA